MSIEADRSAFHKKQFETFTEDSGPYDEHEFGSITHNDDLICWKIDYYDPTLTYGSEDPSDRQQIV